MKKLLPIMTALLITSATAQTTSTTAFPLPDGCKTPDAVSDLGQLIYCRLAIAYQVAESKYESGAAVEDKAREEIVIQNGIKAGARYDVPESEARAFWVDQIEASKVIQRLLIDEWKKQNRPKNKIDLTSVRPQLDALTPAMMRSYRSYCDERTSSSLIRWLGTTPSMPVLGVAASTATRNQPTCLVFAPIKR